MTITYAHVQSGTGEANPATSALTVTAGNLLVVQALERSGTTEANFTISDTAGNTWTKRVGRDIVLGDSSFRRTYGVWTAVANGSGSTTVSVDNGTANVIRVLFSEFEAGAAVTWEFEAAASNDNGATADAVTIATGTTASVAAGDLLLIGGFSLKKNSGAATTQVTTWATVNLVTVANSGPPAANGRYLAIGMLQQSGAGTKASTCTFDADNPSNLGLAASMLVFSATEDSGEITGTGAVTLGAITVAGTAERSITGTGAIALGAIEVDGTGAIQGEVTGSGAITFGPIEVDGTAEREVTDVGGPIELTLPAITVSGTGTAGADVVTGSGAIALGAVTVSGTAEREIPGTGAITLGAVTVSGTAERAISGAGTISLGALAVAGTAERTVTGTGAIALGALAVSGSAQLGGEVNGTGAIALGAITVSGTAERELHASGAITLAALTLAGSGTRATNATGAIALGAIRVSAQGSLTIEGTGAIALGAIEVSGSDVGQVNIRTEYDALGFDVSVFDAASGDDGYFDAR